MRVFWLAPFLALALCSVAIAQEPAPQIRQFDIPTLEKLGHDMYAQDQAGWHATDTLLALHSQAELMREKVGGWIVEDRPEGVLVRFIRQTDSGPEAAYDVSMAGAKPAVSVPQDRALSDNEKAQFGARTLALKSITQRCGDNYNTIVLKDPSGPGWLAWALAATANPDLVMVGGHHRLTVSADGSQVSQMDALSRSCAILQKGGGPAGSQVAALMVTQLVSNVPVETFVFLSLQHHMPFFVLTPDRTLWKIADGRMGNMGAVPVKKAP